MSTFKKLFASIAAIMIVVSTAPVAVFGQTSRSAEYQDAYAYAFANGITTMPSIDAANLAGTTTRGQAAKFFVNFAESRSNTKTNSNCTFSDLAPIAGTDLAAFAVEACEYGLMGINTNGIFKPNGTLSRAEFGTILSRVLFGSLYDGGNPYYAAHLTALNNTTPPLMNDLSAPEREIIRADAMLLLFRASTADLDNALPGFCNDPETMLACLVIDPDGAMGLCPAACLGEEVEEVTPNPLQGDGALQATNVSTFVNNTTIPMASATVIGKVMLSASADDVVINSLTFKHGGFGDRADVSVTLYMESGEGMSSVSNKRTISSEDLVVLNLTSPVVVKKGGSETLLIVVDTSGAETHNAEHTFMLEKAGIVGNALSIAGSFPITLPSFKIADQNAGQVTFSADGSLPSIKLGDAGAVVSKFKAATDGEEDISVSSLTFRRDSASDIQDSDLENFKLYINGNHVASSAMMKSRKVTLTLSTPFVIEKNKSNVKFELRADVVGGANNTVSFYIEDALAQGNKYNAGSLFAGLGSANSYGSTIIEAGAVSLEKVNAANDSIKKNTKRVEFGTIKVTSNSSTAEFEDVTLTIASVNDAAAGAFVQIENLELYNKTNGSVFDLTYVTGTLSKIYSSSDLGLLLQQGVTHELVVRADTLITSTNGDYIVSIANASTDVTITELSDGIEIDDITPNAVVLKKVQIEEPSVTFSQNLLSATYTAVIGSEVEVANFNIKPTDAEDVVLREIKFEKVAGTGISFDNTKVSGFTLYMMNGSGEYVSIKNVGTNQLDGGEVTFSSLNKTLAKDVQHRFKLTTTLVKDANNAGYQFRMGISDYDIEDAVDADEVLHAGAFAPIVSNSNRLVTIQDAGTLSAVVYTSETPLNLRQNLLGNTTSSFVASYELTALNEPALIKDLDMVATVAAGNLIDGVKEVILYANDKTTEIARRTVTSDTVSFNNIDYTVAQGTEKIWVKVSTQRIGLNHPGSATQGIEFDLDVVTADGADSDVALAAVDATAGSTPFNVYPVSVSNVAVDATQQNAVLSDGASTLVARVAVTAASTTNTKGANGATLKTTLEEMNFNFKTLSNATIDGANFELKRVSPLNGTLNSAVPAAGALLAGSTVSFDLTAGFSNNNEVAGTVVFEVYAIATVTTGTANAYLELELVPGISPAVEFGSDEVGSEGYAYVLNETLKFGQLRYNPN